VGRKLFQVFRGRCPHREHVIVQPGNALVQQLVAEKGLPQLARERGHVLQDRKPHPPFSVSGQLQHRRQQGLRQEVHPHGGVDRMKLGDNVEAHLRMRVAEEPQEERQQVGNRVALPQARTQTC
jgi:hypothetical protein